MINGWSWAATVAAKKATSKKIVRTRTNLPKDNLVNPLIGSSFLPFLWLTLLVVQKKGKYNYRKSASECDYRKPIFDSTT
jgi:hypothetical protein